MENKLQIILLLLVVVFLQSTIVPFFAIGMIQPDITLIFIASIAIYSGQIPATIIGFAIGITLDLLLGEFFGLSAFTKTLTGFLVGYIYNENRSEIIFSSYQYIVIVGVTALVHNIIYFAIYTQGTSTTFLNAMIDAGFFSALYTLTITFFPMIYFQRKKSSFIK